MKQGLWPIVAICVGLLLILLSYFVPAQASVRWSEEEATALSQAAHRFHQLTYAPPSAGQREQDEEQKKKLAEAREEFLRQQSELESVRASGAMYGRIVFWLGIVVTIGGVALYRPEQKD